MLPAIERFSALNTPKRGAGNGLARKALVLCKAFHDKLHKLRLGGKVRMRGDMGGNTGGLHLIRAAARLVEPVAVQLFVAVAPVQVQRLVAKLLPAVLQQRSGLTLRALVKGFDGNCGAGTIVRIPAVQIGVFCLWPARDGQIKIPANAVKAAHGIAVIGGFGLGKIGNAERKTCAIFRYIPVVERFLDAFMQAIEGITVVNDEAIEDVQGAIRAAERDNGVSALPFEVKSAIFLEHTADKRDILGVCIRLYEIEEAPSLQNLAGVKSGKFAILFEGVYLRIQYRGAGLRTGCGGVVDRTTAGIRQYLFGVFLHAFIAACGGGICRVGGNHRNGERDRQNGHPRPGLFPFEGVLDAAFHAHFAEGK